jgi:hypothetical protein
VIGVVVIGIEIETEHDSLTVGWAGQMFVVGYESEIESWIDDCFGGRVGCEDWSEIDECHGL